MSLSVRSLVGQASLYGAFTLLRRVVSFALTPLYTHYLSPTDFGVLELLSIAGTFVSILGGFKLDAAFYRFYVAATTDADRQRVLSAAMLSSLVLSTLIVLPIAVLVTLSPIESGGTHVPVGAVYLVLGAMWLDLATSVPVAYCRATNRVAFLGSVSTAQALTTGTVAIIALVVLGSDYTGVLWAMLLGTALTAVCTLTVVRPSVLAWDPGLARELLRYGLPMLPASLFMYVLSTSDRYFLARFASFADLGVYAVAAKFALALQLLVMLPFGEMWATNQFRLYEERNGELYRRVALTYLGTLFVAALAIAYFSYDFILFAFDERYTGAALLTPLLVLGVAIWGIVPTQDLGCLVMPGKTWIRSVATGTGALVAVAANFLLVPHFGTYGAALAVIASYVALASATAALNYRLVDMRAPIPQVSLMVSTLAMLLVVPYAHERLPYVPFLALRVVVLAGYAVGVVALVDPDRLGQFARRFFPAQATPLDGNRDRRIPRVP